MHRAAVAPALGVAVMSTVAVTLAAVVVVSIKVRPSSASKTIVLSMILATYRRAQIKELWSRLPYLVLDSNFRAFEAFE